MAQAGDDAGAWLPGGLRCKRSIVFWLVGMVSTQGQYLTQDSQEGMDWRKGKTEELLLNASYLRWTVLALNVVDSKSSKRNIRVSEAWLCFMTIFVMPDKQHTTASDCQL